jgi:FeS assembly protein IscX
LGFEFWVEDKAQLLRLFNTYSYFKLLNSSTPNSKRSTQNSKRSTPNSKLKTQNSKLIMPFNDIENLPIHWADHEDIAMALYDRFGAEFNESHIYRIRFTDLLEWILEIPNFAGNREGSTEGHLEQIQAKWVYEWRANNQ